MDMFLWVEQYRPKTVDDCILPQNLKNTFKECVEQGNIPNVILSGGPGVGKTTIAKAVLDEIGASKDLKMAEELRQIKAFNESVGLLPKSSEDYYKLALRNISLYSFQRKDIKTIKKSLLHLNKAIQIDPQNVKAFVLRANLNRDIDNFQDALNDYSSAISIDPEYLDAYTERGKTYRITKSFEEAIEDFEKVLEIDPNHYISILNLANL